jgi:uncharacterized surface protein with fasciclin (FAS1) repeats
MKTSLSATIFHGLGLLLIALIPMSLFSKSRTALKSDVAVAVDVISENQFISQSTTSVSDLLRQTPAITTLQQRDRTFTVFVPSANALRNIPVERAQAILGNPTFSANFVNNAIIPGSLDLIDRNLIERIELIDPNAPLEPRTVSMFVQNQRGHPMELKWESDGTDTTVSVNGIPLTGRAEYANNGAVFEIDGVIEEPPTLNQYFDATQAFEIARRMYQETGWGINEDTQNLRAPTDVEGVNPRRTFLLPTDTSLRSTPNLGFRVEPLPVEFNAEEIEVNIVPRINFAYTVKEYVDFTDGPSTLAPTGAFATEGGGAINYIHDRASGATFIGQNPYGAFIGSPALVQEGLVYPLNGSPEPPSQTRDQFFEVNVDFGEISFFARIGTPFEWTPGGTTFAPNNDAFRSQSSTWINSMLNDPDFRSSELNKLQLTGLTSSKYWNFIEQSRVTALIEPGKNSLVERSNLIERLNGNANFLQTDIALRDGIVHKVDSIPQQVPSALEVLTQDRFRKFMDQQLMEDILNEVSVLTDQSGSPVTIFAPTDRAFEAAGIDDPKQEFGSDPGYDAFLRNHISIQIDYNKSFDDYPQELHHATKTWGFADTLGQVYSMDIETLSGAKLNISYLDDNFTVEDNTPASPILVKEGIIYPIDTFFRPTPPPF